MEYIATFYTHSGAIKFQRYFTLKQLVIELMPVPRRLSSNCGIAAKFMYEDDVKMIITEDVEQLYIVNEKEYLLIYKSIDE